MNWKFLYSILFLVLFASCGQYQRALKSGDPAFKYQVADSLHKKGDYARSERLFEQIKNEYKGKPQGERVLYMLAEGYYKRKRYLLAANEYESLLQNYPRSQKAEEVAFLEGKSYFMDSPKYSLYQAETYKAIDKLQNFIDRYPESQYLREANNIMMELLTKLQRKSFEIAKGYNKIKDYQAAIRSLDNFLIDNPGTPFKEEAMYLRLHSAYELAANSVKAKEKQRFENTKALCENFIKEFPESTFKEKTTSMYEKTLKKIENLK